MANQQLFLTQNGDKKMIHTVLDKVSPEVLGFTQCHEHLMLSKGVSFQINEALCIDDLEKSILEAKDYYAAGGKAFVDAQPVGCNRDSLGLVEIAKQTGLHVVASTGFHKMQFYTEDHWIKTIEKDDLAKIYISELTEGMYTNMDTSFNLQQHSARAGIIKTALDRCNLENGYRKLFLAAVEAHKKTGAPMMVHIENGSSPLVLLEFLQENHADLKKIYFCHMDRACKDKEVFQSVLEAGISLEFDTIGRFKYHSDDYEIELIKEIISWGYTEQLLFSLDTTRARLKSYDENAVGLTYLIDSFIPALKAAGVSEKQIQMVGVENPKRILAW